MVPLGSFKIFLRSVKILKREWGVESNRKLPHLFIPSKTATTVPEFAVEDLPLIRGTCDLSPAASRLFPMIIGDNCSTARISSLDAATAARSMCQSWRASVLRGRPEPNLRMSVCSTDHCWKQRHTTDTLCPTCAAIHWYTQPASRRPTVRPVQMAQVILNNLFNRSTHSTAGHGYTVRGLLQNLFTFQSSMLTACRVKTEDAKTDLLSAIWSPMTVTNESLTLQPLSMHIICQSEQSLRVLHFFWLCISLEQLK